MVGKKGISQLISYVFAILLAVIIVAAIAFLAYAFYGTIIKDEAKRELTQVANQVSSKITDTYSLAKASKASPANSTALILADVALNLPEEVAARNYKVTLVTPNEILSFVTNASLNGQNITFTRASQTGKVIAQTTEDPFVTVEFDLPNLEAELQGSTTNPRNATLRYYRYNPNGTIVDALVLGEETLLAQVTVVN